MSDSDKETEYDDLLKRTVVMYVIKKYKQGGEIEDQNRLRLPRVNAQVSFLILDLLLSRYNED